MPQIDAILRFTNLAAALADPVVQQHVTTDPDTGQVSVKTDHVIPDLRVWRASQDTTQTVTDPQTGQTYQQVTHTYLPGYFALVSLPRIVPALRDHPAVQVVINRDTNAVIRRTVTLAVLNDLRFEPVYAGCNYPWGSWA